jgi:hypothetical protein
MFYDGETTIVFIGRPHCFRAFTKISVLGMAFERLDQELRFKNSSIIIIYEL